MMADVNRKTFLISAYACEPGEGSEPGVGWNWAIELSKFHKVIVITRSNNKEKIDKEYDKQKYPGLSFQYCDVPRALTFWKKGQRGLHLYYYLWQIVCYKLAKKTCNAQAIDYAISLTFGNMWMPTFMHLLPCKFIWGPLGGGEGVPRPLWDKISPKQQIFEYIRYFNTKFPLTNPWFFGACKKATLLIVRTTDSLRCIPKKFQDKCEMMIETGISENDISHFRNILEDSQKQGELKDFMICGKMVPFKMFQLAIDAYAEAINRGLTDSKLYVVGDGPLSNSIKKRIESLGLTGRIIMKGKLSRTSTLQLMAECKALLLTSAREGGSWVMFEAMLLKKPIICFDSSGMHMVVTEETGFLVPECAYEKAVLRFADSVIRCAEIQTCEMGEKAYLRVCQQFTWSGKIGKILERLGESCGKKGFDYYDNV